MRGAQFEPAVWRSVRAIVKAPDKDAVFQKPVIDGLEIPISLDGVGLFELYPDAIPEFFVFGNELPMALLHEIAEGIYNFTIDLNDDVIEIDEVQLPLYVPVGDVLDVEFQGCAVTGAFSLPNPRF